MNDERFRHDLDRVTWRDIGDDVAVFDVETGEIRSLAGSAAVLWRSLAPTASRSDLAEALCAEFDVSLDVARDDIEVFLSAALAAGMVVASMEPAGRPEPEAGPA